MSRATSLWILAAIGFTVGQLPAQIPWTQVTVATAPPARRSHSMVWDSGRGLAVLFGGLGSGSAFLNDTWEWDGRTWLNRTPANSPTARAGQAMAYDARRGVVVMFGGHDPSTALHGALQDTWEWNGTTWTRRATSGPRRAWAAMSYHAGSQRIVMFGGSEINNTGYGYRDTWTWDGVAWTQVATTGPPESGSPAMAYDAARDVCVLYGGSGTTETWEWDGSAWTLRTPATSPPRRSVMALAYDPVRRRCVFYSGSAGGPVPDDTWEWDGTTWAQNVSPTPGIRTFYGLCWDGNQRRLLLFGGARAGTVVPYGDTWTYGAPVPARYVIAGTACAGANGLPALDPGTTLPWIGETLTVTATGLGGAAVGMLGWSDTMAGPFPLPQELSAFGMPGCRLYVSLDVTLPLAVSSGRANWSLFLPNRVSMVGWTVYQQVVTDAPGANPTGLVLSDYGTATVGVR
ncbi:MAG: hypothetical protein IPM13_18740 [Phycisphaerales bacterium]|nr:hypothetical protein [Phycisphaerales bacterium]